MQRQTDPERVHSPSADVAITVAVGSGAREAPASETTPTQLGRYIVVEQVGAGGMGRVLRAYDPRLRREVALKLLSPGAHESEGAARIVREAQAMAQLSHPNLVPVYDVEQDGDALFIAMELVEGDTLRTWLGRASRSWREVLAAFVAAGHGLAAAHAAGIIHRDFKPSNAIVASDGRVRVMDFGLARAVAGESENVADFGFAASADLTLAGTVMGTPPYMAPEQHQGEVVVPATDQYAFCVALYEALFRVRPFAGSDLQALARAKLRGAPAAADGTARHVPRWLRAAVVRGLAVEPAARWPTMDALLATLERGQARARARRVLAGVGVLGLVGAGAVLLARLDTQRRTAACERVGASIDEVWNDAARSRVRAALLATGMSYAGTTADKVMPWLDAHTRAWQAARNETCLDEEVRGVADRDAIDRSLWCLDERRMEIGALVDELSAAPAAVVQKAVTAAAGLPKVDTCRDAGLLARLPLPPTEGRAEIRAARAEVSRASALERTGEYARGLELARSARDRIDAAVWPPLSALARAHEARLLSRLGEYDEAEQIGTQAYLDAANAGAWDVAAGAASGLAFVIGDRLARPAEARTWAGHARVALTHAGDPDDLREAGRLGTLANVYQRAGDPLEARALQERSLAILERALGPDHPDVASSLNNLAVVVQTTGDYAEARTLYERALAIRESTLGPDHPHVAATVGNLGLVCYAAGEYPQARAMLERALASMEATLGPDHPNVGSTLGNLASVHQAMGDLASAGAMYRRALAIFEKTLGPEHPDVAASIANVANVHSLSGNHAEALPLFARSLAIAEKALQPDHPDLALRLSGVAQAHVASGDDRSAVPLFERAVAIYDKHAGDQIGELPCRFALAKAMVATGRDRARARVLAERAREGWRALGEGKAALLAEVDQWLRDLDAP